MRKIMVINLRMRNMTNCSIRCNQTYIKLLIEFVDKNICPTYEQLMLFFKNNNKFIILDVYLLLNKMIKKI